MQVKQTYEWQCPTCDHVNERTSTKHCDACEYVGTTQCKKCKRRFELTHLNERGLIYNLEA